MSGITLTNDQALAAKRLAEYRKMAVHLFRPLPHQEPIFRQPRPKWMLVDGGNRGGKTITLVAFTSAFAMDKTITFLNGEEHPARMPWQKDRPVDIWIVCIDADHIGRAIYPHFFKAGEFAKFRTIYDKKTKQLRPFRHGEDRFEDSYPHEPMIPSNYIEHIAWEDYAKRIFKSVSIKDPVTGKPLATIRAFTSKGDPPQGNAVDLIFVDEQLAKDGYITELQSRLLDKRGQLVWSSYCKDAGDDEDDLSKFSSMIERKMEEGATDALKVTLTMSGNTTMSKQEIAETLGGYATEEERLQRDLGVRPSSKLRMYPLFDKSVHCVEGYGDELEEVLGRTDGIPPNTWTKTLILDPGTQHPCVLLCAVPPPELGEYYVPYMEIYPGRADPWQLSKKVAEATKGEVFWKFIIDDKAGKQQTMGMRDGAKVKTQYELAWEEAGIVCATTKSKFVPGSSDVGGRQLVLSGWLHNNNIGIPKLRIVTHRCPNLVQQMAKVKKMVSNKDVREDRKAPGFPHDAIDCYDAETEVLTEKHGWLKFSELSGNERLATMNVDTLKMEFQLPTKIISKYHSGEMVRIKSTRLDMLVTPNHRMLVLKNRSDRFEFEPASKLCRSHRIPLSCKSGFDGVRPKLAIPRVFNGRHQIDEIEDVPAFAELVGLYLAAGCCVKYKKKGRGYQVSISQKKPEGRVEVERILDANPFHYTKDGINYLISHKQLWHYLKPLGNVYTKHVPQWIKDSDTETREAFLRGYLIGDGWLLETSIGSASVSERLTDDIQEIAIRSGLCCIKRHVKAKSCKLRGAESFNTKDQYHTVISHLKPLAGLVDHKDSHREAREKFETVEYEGMVYCASVPNTTLVVRRNGRVAICGNCLEYFSASAPRYIIVPKPKQEEPECYKRYMSKFGSTEQNKPLQVGTFY